MYTVKPNEAEILATLPQVLTDLGFHESRSILGYRHHPGLLLAVRVTRGLVQVLDRDGGSKHLHPGEFIERYAVGHCAVREIALDRLDDYERGGRANPAAPASSTLYESWVKDERNDWRKVDAAHPRGVGPCPCGLPRNKR